MGDAYVRFAFGIRPPSDVSDIQEISTTSPNSVDQRPANTKDTGVQTHGEPCILPARNMDPGRSHAYKYSLQDTLESIEPRIHLEMEGLLAPVHAQLQKLKSMTVDSLPPYNPHIRTKQYAQVIKTRLLPIGRFIVGHLASVPVGDKGSTEMQICQHIAIHYWPLTVSSTTHLRIQEMYRNALFGLDSSVVHGQRCVCSSR